jgi:uncharacterized membrane protein HdeD (DUF308 family)
MPGSRLVFAISAEVHTRVVKKENSTYTSVVDVTLEMFLLTDEKVQPEQILSDQQLLPWWLLLLWGIFTLIIGCMFLITPFKTMDLFIMFLGAYWLVGGLFTLGSLLVDRSNLGIKIFLSVINIFAGIIILVNPIYALLFATGFAIIFIGFWACFIGAAHLYHSCTAKDAGTGVLGIISIIFGLLLLVNIVTAIVMLPFVFGGFAIVSGIASIYVAFMAKKVQTAS